MTEEKAAKIKLVFLDVDGVMTDGRITMDAQGKETKSFCVKDGLGLRMLMSGGVDVVIVTGRSSQVVEHRANDLGIKEVHQGVTDKSLLCRQIIKDRGFTKQEICCIGDDLADLPMFSEAGLCIAVADAVKEVREAADFITRSKGGFGAVREACEWLLKCQGKWQTALSPFAGE
jgi:3-deoxy-D-manno-octulosonate 8-phosphate phosphatase (KDO 8-P phosphatase)